MNKNKFEELNPLSIIKFETDNEKDGNKEYLKITYSKIETDNGLEDLFNYQSDMLYRIINNNNTYLSNQSNALYGNYCFEKTIKYRNFEYNMVLLENGKIYSYNITTGKFRRIYYRFKIIHPKNEDSGEDSGEDSKEQPEQTFLGKRKHSQVIL